jgi:hypothetical protein
MIKFAPVLTAERYNNPKWERPGRDFYWSGSLTLLPRRETPLLVNHDESRQVGIVRELSVLDWTDGKWICAHVTVTDPPCWLDKRTAASFGRIDVHAPLMGKDAKRVTSAFVKEVSLLPPGVEPAEPLAQVLWIGEAESPAAGLSSDRPVAGEVILGGERIARRYTGQILAVEGQPVRTSSGYPLRREGRDYIVDRRDGLQVIYSGVDAYREALYDGQVLGVR